MAKRKHAGKHKGVAGSHYGPHLGAIGTEEVHQSEHKEHAKRDHGKKGGSYGHQHQGEMHRGTMHLHSHKGHDGMAHESHHAANQAHGTPMGFCPDDGYQDGGCDHHLGDNVHEED